MKENIKVNQKARILIDYAKHVPSGLFVEIGSIRHLVEDEDGWSTKYLADYCQIECHGEHKKFLSYDIDKEAVKIANQVLIDHQLIPIVSKQDGVEAIKKFAALNYPINFLLLDSHKNPAVTFEQYKAALLAPDSVLIIDDAQEIEQWKFGKASFVKQVFDAHGQKYKIINTIPGYKMFVASIKNGKKSGEL